MSALPANLGLPDREAITDALYRSIVGLDANDKAIYESAWHKDATFIYEFTETSTLEGLDTILATTFQFIGAGLDTTHMVSNVRLSAKEGASTAAVTCHALAQHNRKGEGLNPTATRFLTGSMYWVDLARDAGDGLWKITKFHLKVVWCEGDASIMGQ